MEGLGGKTHVYRMFVFTNIWYYFFNFLFLFVFSSQAQGLEQQEEAMGYIRQAKEILHILESEVYSS